MFVRALEVGSAYALAKLNLCLRFPGERRLSEFQVR
jgi:hypothetical protein